MGLRADLMARLRLLVQTEGWTQAQAAEKFGIAQSRGNDLLRGIWGAAVATWREHPTLSVNAKVPLCRL
jgi:predicted XRE-type DNA-binding protein